MDVPLLHPYDEGYVSANPVQTAYWVGIRRNPYDRDSRDGIDWEEGFHDGYNNRPQWPSRPRTEEEDAALETL